MRLFLFLAAILLLSATPASAQIIDIELLRADVNSDGTVDNSDPTALMNYLWHGSFSPTCLDACDVNDDASVDNSDVIFLLEYIFNGGSAPEAPYPYCGTDDSSDSLGCVDSYCSS